MKVPFPTPIYRILHLDNLDTCLRRRALHAPNHVPDDGLPYRTIHSVEIQERRRERKILCGPGGVIHDYVSFYFGRRSPMLYQLHTGWVPGYKEGQRPIVYLVSSVQKVAESGATFTFSDGHGIAVVTKWFAELDFLDRVDWRVVNATLGRTPFRTQIANAESRRNSSCTGAVRGSWSRELRSSTERPPSKSRGSSRATTRRYTRWSRFCLLGTTSGTNSEQ